VELRGNHLAIQLARFVYIYNRDDPTKSRSLKIKHNVDLGDGRLVISNGITLRLIGFIEHVGETLHGGHYLAYVCHSGDRWYRYNDSAVTSMPKADALRVKQAYLLFYRRETMIEYDERGLATFSPSRSPQVNASLSPLPAEEALSSPTPTRNTVEGRGDYARARSSVITTTASNNSSSSSSLDEMSEEMSEVCASEVLGDMLTLFVCGRMMMMKVAVTKKMPVFTCPVVVP
jgi:hypothetical protein